jgi:hypothetical protein
MTKLVNLHKTKQFDVKIDRTTEFGNPHPIGYCVICKRVHDRKDCIEEYKKYFYNRILTDKIFHDKVLTLKGKVLACWCHPLECHGNVIIETIDETL